MNHKLHQHIVNSCQHYYPSRESPLVGKLCDYSCTVCRIFITAMFTNLPFILRAVKDPLCTITIIMAGGSYPYGLLVVHEFF